MRFILTLLISAVCFCAPAVPVTAALPPEVRKELSDLSSELRPIIVMVRKKEIDEAKAIIQNVEDRIKELAIAEDEKDRSFTSLQLALAK